MSWLHLMTEEKLKEQVPNCFSKRELLNNLGLAPYGGNYKTLNAALKKFKIDASHFTGRGWRKGRQFINKKSIPLKDILVKNSTYTNSNCLRKRLLKEKIFDRKCYGCGNTEWQGKPIPIELEHKNGDNRDHRIKNLTLLCPNCHALSKHYRGKNADWGKLKSKIKKEKIRIRKEKEAIIRYCTCGNKLNKKNKTGHCIICIKKVPKIEQRKVPRPDREQLKELIRTLPFTTIGKNFGVSDNAVRKWAKNYKLDLPKRLGYWAKIKAGVL